MKKNLVFACFMVCLNLLGVSCSNLDDEIDLSILETKTSGNTQLNTLSFIYNKEVYFSECEELDDSVIILNEAVREVANQLASISDLAALVHEDGIIEYFDSWNVLQQSLAQENKEKSNSIVNVNLRNFRLKNPVLSIYDDINYKDRSFTFKEPIEIPQLKDKPYEFNDKMSSFKFYYEKEYTEDFVGPVVERYAQVTFWEDDNYKNHSLTYVLHIDPSIRPGGGLYPCEVASMKNIPLYPGSSRNWNDKVTSLRFAFNTFEVK